MLWNHSLHTVSIGGASTGKRVIVAGSGLVDVVLEDSSVNHREASESETASNTSDWSEWDTQLAKAWVKVLLDEWKEDDNGDWVKVEEKIVRKTVSFHRSSHRNEVGNHLSVNEPVDWIEEEDSAGNETTAKLINKHIAPWDGETVTANCNDGWLSSIQVSLVLDTNPEHLSGFNEDGTLWWTDDIFVLAEDKNGDGDEEETEWEKVSSPEVNLQLEPDGGDGGERTKVDTPVEDVEDRLHGDGRIQDDTLTAWEGLDSHLGLGVLFSNEWRDVGFDSYSSQSKDNHADNESRKTSAVVQSEWERGNEDDEDTAEVDTSEKADSLVTTEPCISYNSSENWGDVAPELEEIGKCSSSRLAQSQGTRVLSVSLVLHIVLYC
jgi:hypothetical protein